MKYADRIVRSSPDRQELTTRLLKVLPSILPQCTIAPKQHVGGAGKPADVVWEMQTPSGRRRTLYVEPRMASAPSQVLHSLHQLKARFGDRRRSYPVLAATFLSPRVRTLCREHGIGYLDLAGNYYLQFDDVYLERTVERNPFPHRGRPASLFSSISSRIVRALLEEPHRTWMISELADACQVSLGHTSNVCRRLIEESYAERNKRGVRVTRPGELLEAWRDAGPSASSQTAYYSFERDPEQLLRRVAEVGAKHRWHYAVTSFGAAARIAPFVRGVGMAQWYVSGPRAVDEWVKALDLRPVESGPNVTLITPYDAGVFYHTQTVDRMVLVGNVQLYLDLCQDPGRGVEQAAFLRTERLTF